MLYEMGTQPETYFVSYTIVKIYNQNASMH